MKKLLLSVAVVSMCAFFTATGGEKKDATKIDGTWTAIEPADLVAALNPVLEFKDGKYSETIMGKQNESGTYKIDATKSPFAIDLTINEGEDKGKVQLGILKIDGDKLTLALAQPGAKDRPKDFDGTDGFGAVVYKRNK